MVNTKINLLILPLLIAILLSTLGKLKIGPAVNNVFYTVLTPIHFPIGLLRQNIDTQISYIKSIPKLREQYQILLSQNANLLSENEQLKQTLTDSKTIVSVSNFKNIIPVRLSGSIGSNLVTSSLSLEKVKKGQALVFNKILLGIVFEVRGSVINITPLDNEHIGSIAVHTTSGQKGQYKLINNTPQITDISNLTPINIGDYVFTEPSEEIPENLVIGKITKIISNQQEPLQKAQITLESGMENVSKGLAIVILP